MAIFKNGKSVSAIFKGTTPIIKLYKGTQLIWQLVQEVIKTLVGIPPLSFTSNGEDLVDYKIYGNSIQDGVPTPSAPIEIQSVGELTENGYKIPIVVKNRNLFQFKKGEITGGVVAKQLENGAIYNGDNVYSPFSASTGWVRSGITDETGNCLSNLQVDDVITISADFTILEWGLADSYFKAVRIGTFTRENSLLDFKDFSISSLKLKKRFSATFTVRGAYVGKDVYPFFGVNTNTVQIENIQIEYGSVATPFVPYEEKTVDIYLDEPLRKIGDYKDYIDFANKKLVRQIEERPCSELDWFQHQTYKNIYSVNSARFKKATGLNPLSSVFNSTEYDPSVSIANMKKDYCIKAHASSSAIYISDSVHTTIDEFDNFVKDFKIAYVLNTPIEETIELPNIPTSQGLTILDVATTKPNNMEIVYKE